jgi:hypothetical protein
MRGLLKITTAACVMAVVASGPVAAQSPIHATQLAVCLVRSEKLPINARASAIILVEVNAIWAMHGVSVRWADDGRDGCARLITVKGEHEAFAEDAASESALAWVSFVEGRARQLVFLRVGRARLLVQELPPGTVPKELTDWLTAKLIGRSLAHELGHVLLNSRSHQQSGLMRARYRARDILSVPTSAYTLNALERATIMAQSRDHVLVWPVPARP